MSQNFKSFVTNLLKGMNHDFCPNLNQYVYWLKKPVGWIVSGVFFSLLVGLLIGPQGFVLMWSFLALLLMGIAWPWLSMKGLTCELSFEERRSQENEPVKIVLTITNKMPLPAFGLMVSGQFLQDVLTEDDEVAVALKRVPAWSVCRFDWTISPKHRGRIPTHTPILSTGFPFGLYCTEKPVEVTGDTIVWPACRDLDGVPAMDGNQFNVEGTASRRAGNDGETIGVREYRHGDSIRNIHWNHTARCNRLIVKEKQSLTQTPVRIVVDLAPGHHSGIGSQSTFEWAIRVAASVCKQLHDHHAHIDLICLGIQDSNPNRTSNRHGIRPVLDFLALLPQFEPGSERIRTEPDYGRQVILPNRYTVLIHTLAFPASYESENVKHICIAPEGYSRDEFDETDEALIGFDHSHKWADSKAVTSPQFAHEQLDQLWAGGVHGHR